jgi:hypothetical protein
VKIFFGGIMAMFLPNGALFLPLKVAHIGALCLTTRELAGEKQ